MTKIRVLIADDHGVVRAGLRAILKSQSDIEVSGEAADGHQAVAMTAETAPDLVLLDLKMPGLDGFKALRSIKAQNPHVKVLVLTMFDDESYLRKALEAGASGYILKQAADVELLTAIRAVYAGGVYLDPTLTEIVAKGFLSSRRDRTESRVKEAEDGLSGQEREVLRLLAYGYTNKQIAEKLVLSVKTVESYKGRIVDKLGLRGRAALTRYALEKGLLGELQ